MKKVAVVILNYNGWKDTIECIESFEGQVFDAYQIIVVDNNSKNNSVAQFKKYFTAEFVPESKYFLHPPVKKNKNFVELNAENAITKNADRSKGKYLQEECLDNIILIKTGDNLGFSGGNNIGARYAVNRGFDYILLLNNDTVIIDKDFLTKLTSPFQIDDSTYLTGPQINNYEGTFDGPYIEDTFIGNLFGLSILNFFRRRLKCPSIYIDVNAISSPEPIQVYKISGACLMFKTSSLIDIQFLDENVWLSSEEAIISEKIKKRKGRIIFQPLTTLIHKKAQTPRPKSDRYNILKNHYKQRKYFYINYRNYGLIKMTVIGFMTFIRLSITKIRK